VSNKASRDTLTDPKKVESYEQLMELRAEYEQRFLEEVLSTVAGRRVIYNMVAMGDVYNLQGTMPLDSVQHNRQEGRREMALEILHRVLHVQSNVYIMMQREADSFEKQFEANGLEPETEED